MHPITQTILAAGVLALVGMGGYAMVYGVPEYEEPPTALDELKAANKSADKTLCEFTLSRPLSAYNDKGKADWFECRRKYPDL
jgi:hypothetical protein